MALHAKQLTLPACSSRAGSSSRPVVTAAAGMRPHARHTSTNFSHSVISAQQRQQVRLQPCRVASLDRPAIKPSEDNQQPQAGADSPSTTERMKQQSQAYLDQYVLPPAREVLQQVGPPHGTSTCRSHHRWYHQHPLGRQHCLVAGLSTSWSCLGHWRGPSSTHAVFLA
jgi:hypothetical protein